MGVAKIFACDICAKAPRATVKRVDCAYAGAMARGVYCESGSARLLIAHAYLVSSGRSGADRGMLAGGGPIFGVTVADLARDGMVTVTVTGKHAIAALTRRGSWFARTAATELAEQA
jgi:hypothetical protein